MNLIEHYILEVLNVEDVSNKYFERVGQMPEEPLYEVKMKIDCYGDVKNTVERFYKSEWEQIQAKGYYLA